MTDRHYTSFTSMQYNGHRIMKMVKHTHIENGSHNNEHLQQNVEHDNNNYENLQKSPLDPVPSFDCRSLNSAGLASAEIKSHHANLILKNSL